MHSTNWDQKFSIVLCSALVATGACARDPEAVKARHLESAEQYLVQGKRPEAILEFRNALQAQPQDGNVRLKLAEAYWSAKSYAEGAAEYLRAADQLPDRVDVQLKAGSVLLLVGRFDDAKVRAEKVLAVAPQHVEGHILLANALAGLKQFEAAIDGIEEAIRLSPESGVAFAGLGALEMRRGNYEPAERAFKRAVELDSHAAAPRLALANFYWSRRRWTEAELELKQAVERDPQNAFAHRGLATLAFVLNRPGSAEQHLKRVVDITGSPAAVLSLADFYVATRDVPAARSTLEPLLTSPDVAGQANVRLAGLDHLEGRSSDAHARIDRVLAAEPKNLQALVTKSRMLLDDGKADEACLVAKAAIQADPAEPAGHFALARAEQARNRPDAAITAYQDVVRLNPDAANAHVAIAQLSLRRGQPAGAVASAEEVLKTDPKNADARLVLVRGLLARGELRRAETEIGKLIAEFPKSAAVRAQRGRLLARLQDVRGARAEFEIAASLAPTSIDALAGLVSLDLMARQPEAARARVKPHVERRDAPPGVLMLAARTYMATGQPQIAEPLLRRVLQQDPTELSAYAALGQLYVSRNRMEEALAEFDAMARRDGGSVSAHTMAGIILEHLGRAAEAQSRYRSALAVDPTAPIAANNLAWMYVEAGENLDVALQLAQAAYARVPESAAIADTLGFIYYKKELLQQAIRILRSAVEKDPTQAVYHYHLGLALARGDDTSGATKHLTQALKLETDFPGASDARATLDALDRP